MSKVKSALTKGGVCTCMMCVMFDADCCALQDSRILYLARDQKQDLMLAASTIRLLKQGVYSGRERSRNERWAKGRINRAIESEREMIELAFKRPEDFEEFGNYDLVGAISNLTQSRVKRLAYFGRVLP